MKNKKLITKSRNTKSTFQPRTIQMENRGAQAEWAAMVQIVRISIMINHHGSTQRQTWPVEDLAARYRHQGSILYFYLIWSFLWFLPYRTFQNPFQLWIPFHRCSQEYISPIWKIICISYLYSSHL